MKFLMVYPNNTGNQKVPLGCVYLLNILENLGHEVDFFDMTFFGIDIEKHDIDIRGRLLNFRPIDLQEWGVTYSSSTTEQVFQKLADRVKEFQPDAIGITLTEDTSIFGIESMAYVRKHAPDIPIMAGGVFCMTQPEYVLSYDCIDMVSIGEGEYSLPELVGKMERGENYYDVPGHYFKTESGEIIKNPVTTPTDLNELPLPNLDFIDPRHFLSPMAGKVYKMTFVEGQRGCPRRCTYCCNQLFLDTYKDHRKTYLRKKTIPRLVAELEHLKNKYDFNFFQFTDDDFTLRSEAELREFKKLYLEKVNVPWWCQAEANNLSETKMQLMREAGCIAISMGIETGSKKILEDVYHRKTSRKKTIEAFNLMHKYGIRTSGNVIVGVPEETREDIFKTIELARECAPKSLSINIFAPYRGTVLRDVCVKEGFLDDDFVRDGRESWKPVLNLPQLSQEEIIGLVRTFALYSTLPKSVYPLIQRCEKWDEESEILFNELEQMFWDISDQNGMNVYVSGFDYEEAFEKHNLLDADL